MGQDFSTLIKWVGCVDFFIRIYQKKNSINKIDMNYEKQKKQKN